MRQAHDDERALCLADRPALPCRLAHIPRGPALRARGTEKSTFAIFEVIQRGYVAAHAIPYLEGEWLEDEASWAVQCVASGKDGSHLRYAGPPRYRLSRSVGRPGPVGAYRCRSSPPGPFDAELREVPASCLHRDTAEKPCAAGVPSIPSGRALLHLHG